MAQPPFKAHTSWLGVWESSFPTHPDDPAVARGAATVRSHAVFFYSAVIHAASRAELPSLTPQRDECSCAHWFRVGPRVAAAAAAAMTTAGAGDLCEPEGPSAGGFFERNGVVPRRVGLTLELAGPERADLGRGAGGDGGGGGNADADAPVVDASGDPRGVPVADVRRMLITSGAEFFIQRAVERLLLNDLE